MRWDCVCALHAVEAEVEHMAASNTRAVEKFAARGQYARGIAVSSGISLSLSLILSMAAALFACFMRFVPFG